MTMLPWEQKCLRSLRIRPCQHRHTKPNPDLESVIDQQFVISNKNWFNFDIFSIPSITSITPVWAGREGRKGTRFSCWFVVNTELTLVITHQFQHLDQLIIITTHLVPQLMFLAPLQAVCLSLSADRIFLKSWNLLLLPTSHLPPPHTQQTSGSATNLISRDPSWWLSDGLITLLVGWKPSIQSSCHWC